MISSTVVACLPLAVKQLLRHPLIGRAEPKFIGAQFGDRETDRHVRLPARDHRECAGVIARTENPQVSPPIIGERWCKMVCETRRTVRAFEISRMSVQRRNGQFAARQYLFKALFEIAAAGITAATAIPSVSNRLFTMMLAGLSIPSRVRFDPRFNA
jgi:hypothetical protein